MADHTQVVKAEDEDTICIGGPGLKVVEKLRVGMTMETRIETLGKCVAMVDKLYDRVLSGGKFYVQDENGDFVRARLFKFEADADDADEQAAKKPKHSHLRLVGKDD